MLVYFIDTVNRLKRALGECLDIDPKVNLVHNDLYWAKVLRDFTTHWADLSRKKCDVGIFGWNQPSILISTLFLTPNPHPGSQIATV